SFNTGVRGWAAATTFNSVPIGVPLAPGARASLSPLAAGRRWRAASGMGRTLLLCWLDVGGGGMFRIVSLFLGLLLLRPSPGAADSPLLLQKPALSAGKIVFAFANDLWTVDRSGGDAVRLTTGVGVETDPHFSPDGTQI